MATNTIKAQSRIADKAFYIFEQSGVFLKSVNFKSEDFKPSDNVGGTYTYRRPGKISTQATALSARGTTPTVGSAPSYSAYTEPTFSLTVARKFRQALAVSQQDLTTALTEDQVVERSIKQAAVALRRQIESYALGVAIAGSSQVVGTPGTASTGATLLNNFNTAGSLITSRGLEDKGDRIALIPTEIKPTLMESVRGLYNPQGPVSSLFTSGSLGKIGNLNFAETPLIPSDAVNVAGTPTLTVTGAYQNAGAVWTPYWNLIVTSTAGLVVPAGTLFAISNSGTTIKWVVPDVFTDLSYQATFRTVTDVTLDGSGVGTLVVTEPLIPAQINVGGDGSNGYQNVNANPANGATLTLLNDVASAKPSVVFDPDAILGVSPKIYVPEGIWSKTENINGVNVTMIKSADPFNYSAIWELQAMVGFTVGLPEGVATVY